MFVQTKHIEVDFDSSVNIEPFDAQAYREIKQHGLFLTKLNLFHYASIHYQSRNANSPSGKLWNTFDAWRAISPSLINSSGSFLFSDHEDSELQKQSSEVIAVGFANHLMHRLLNVNSNRINKLPIQGVRKRCDFEVLKQTKRYIFEAKGRKREYDLKYAKQEIADQKAAYDKDIAKFGVITHIPRDGTPTKIYVTDPEVNLPKINRHYIIISLLQFYSSAARLAGFYRLSEKINQRLIDIEAMANDTKVFNGRGLDYSKTVKLGKSITFFVGEHGYESFFSPNLEMGLKLQFRNGKMLIFGMESEILEILDEQDFDKLLTYEIPNEFKNGRSYSVLDNGSFLILADEDKIPGAI